MVVRTWNLFHGNTLPPGRRAYLRQMVERVTADKPDVVCLQEVPAWALGVLGTWAGMHSVSARARRSALGPFPVPAAHGRALTSLHHGVLRSAFAGQGNAILIPSGATVRATRTITLNTNVFCEERGAKLGLTPRAMRRWERERRICHLVQYELPKRRLFTAATLHATNEPADPRLADAELRRATSFVERGAELDEVLILAGDFNLTPEQSKTIEELLAGPPESRWSDSGPLVDHVLLRGARPLSVRVWPDAERMLGGRLLSDHAPVEVEIEIR